MAYRLRTWELTSEDTISLTDYFFNTESEPVAWAESNKVEHYEARDDSWQLLGTKGIDSIKRRDDGSLRPYSGPVALGN